MFHPPLLLFMWQQNKDFLQKHRGWAFKAFLIAELLEEVGKEERSQEKERKAGTTSPRSGRCDSTKRFWESSSCILLTLIMNRISIIYPSQTLCLTYFFTFAYFDNKCLKQYLFRLCQKHETIMTCHPSKLPPLVFYYSPRGAKAAFTITLYSQSTPTKGN